MAKTILALALSTAVTFAGAAEARHRHHAPVVRLTVADCVALQKLHAAIGTVELKRLAKINKITREQRAAGVYCLKHRR